MKRGDGNRWAEDDDDDDDEDGREDGELAADAPSAKRQRHAPIVWAARGGDKPPGRAGAAGAGGGPQREPHMEKVESTTRLAGLAGSGAGSPAAGPSPGPPRPRSAAELIAAEAEEFRRRAALEDDIDPAAPPAMRASPSGSDDGGKPCT